MVKEIDRYLKDVASQDMGQHLTQQRNAETLDRLKSDLSEIEYKKVEKRAEKFARFVLGNVENDVMSMPAYFNKGPHIMSPSIDDATLDMLNVKISDTALKVHKSTVTVGVDQEDWLRVGPLYTSAPQGRNF